MYNNPNYFSYTNPSYYSYTAPNFNSTPKFSLFSKLKGINWNSLLNNTSRTLNVINQAIPLYYQVKPLFRNMSTLFKIADIIKSSDNSEKSFSGKKELYLENTGRENKKEDVNSSSGPTFFL